MEQESQPPENLGPCLKIDRQVFAHKDEFDMQFYKTEAPGKGQGIREQMQDAANRAYCATCTGQDFLEYLKRVFPILAWLPRYSWKSQFVHDVVAGCTVAIMHIPQGMGYALLGGVPPIIGLYMAFFPVLVYVLFGTSHHISMGTFAITTLMTGKVVQQYANVGDGADPIGNATFPANGTLGPMTNVEVATAVSLMVGLWQILMYICQLGIIGIVLSDQLVSGFTTGAAIHVLISQIKSLLGLDRVPTYNGPFRLVRTMAAVFNLIPTTRTPEAIISVVTIIVLVIHNDWLKPWYSKKIKFIAPTELFVLIVGTAASYFGNLNRDYGVHVLEHIPTGFPVPRIPPHNLLSYILMDTFVIAVVAYAVSLSMAKIFARKRGYDVKNNQELLAQGASNVCGSFFSCMPVSASLSRSMIQESVGGETQLASVVSCLVVLNVLLWIGPFFESLPLAILASVIVVALKGMFAQFKDFFVVMKISPLDAGVWMVTFLSVVVVDIDIGLLVGIIASVSLLIYRGHRPYAAFLGRLPGTELHVDLNLYPNAVEMPGFTIFRWVGAIHFANAEAFRRALDGRVGTPACSSMVPMKSISSDKDLSVGEDSGRSTFYGAVDSTSGASPTLGVYQDLQVVSSNPSMAISSHLLLDFSAVSYVDLTGAKILGLLYSELRDSGVTLGLSGCTDPVMDQLERYNYFSTFPRTQVYPTIMDAVLSIQHAEHVMMNSSTMSQTAEVIP